MSTLAETLQAARHLKELSLEEVERATRIRAAYIQALEADDFRRLPPPVYTRGFVRNYAAHLDLDPQQMVRLYDEAIGYRPEPVRMASSGSVHIASLMAPNIAAIAVAMVLAVILFVWLYSAFFAEGPARSARLPTPVVPTPTALSALVLPTLTVTPEPTQGTPETVAVKMTPMPTARTAAGQAQSEPLSTAPPSTAATPTPQPHPLMLKVRVVEVPSWMQVRTDGVVVFTGTMAAGAERTFNAKEEIFIHAGRSDAVELSLNEVSQGRLGRPGQMVVRRTFTRQDAATASHNE